MSMRESTPPWNGKLKAVTLSYDDGIEQDRRLIDLLDQYGLRATFNLNPGKQRETDTFIKSGITVRHINLRELPQVYEHHEVAGHTQTHAHLEQLEEADIREEIVRCQDGLAQLFGREIPGMAYPYGTYDDRVVRIAQEAGILYARTCIETEGFAQPIDLLRLETTCRHANPAFLSLAEAFAESRAEAPQLFYLWGHSYEFDETESWPLMEAFCKIIAGKDDIFYGTNSEVLLNAPHI